MLFSKYAVKPFLLFNRFPESQNFKQLLWYGVRALGEFRAAFRNLFDQQIRKFKPFNFQKIRKAWTVQFFIWFKRISNPHFKKTCFSETIVNLRKIKTTYIDRPLRLIRKKSFTRSFDNFCPLITLQTARLICLPYLKNFRVSWIFLTKRAIFLIIPKRANCKVFYMDLAFFY